MMMENQGIKSSTADDQVGHCQAQCQESSIVSSSFSPTRLHDLQAVQSSTFDTPLRRGGGTGAGRPSTLSSPTYYRLMKDQTYHVAGMDLLTYKSDCTRYEETTRRERYDPCCTAFSLKNDRLVTSIRSFDHDILACNRKRAQSDTLNKATSSSLAKPKRNSEDQNHSTVVKSRKRFHSTGPLIGTTVFVGCSSKDSFDSESCSDETISSIETPGEDLKTSLNHWHGSSSSNQLLFLNDNIESNHSNHHSTRVDAQAMLNTTKEPYIEKTSYLLNLPNFFLGSRRRKSKVIQHAKENLHHHGGNVMWQSDNMDSNATVVARDTVSFYRRILQAFFLICLGIVACSNGGELSNNSTRSGVMTGAIAKDSPMASVAKPTDSATAVEIRTVKNFSGAWGLTLSDSEDENLSGNLRKKRRPPKLSEANSMYTQQLSSATQPINFVLTDDEIKKKTKSWHEQGSRKYRYSTSLMTVYHPVDVLVNFAWISLFLTGFVMAWFELTLQCRRSRSSAKHFGGSSYRHNR